MQEYVKTDALKTEIENFQIMLFLHTENLKLQQILDQKLMNLKNQLIGPYF